MEQHKKQWLEKEKAFWFRKDINGESIEDGYESSSLRTKWESDLYQKLSSYFEQFEYVYCYSIYYVVGERNKCCVEFGTGDKKNKFCFYATTDKMLFLTFDVSRTNDRVMFLEEYDNIDIEEMTMLYEKVHFLMNYVKSMPNY